MWKAVKLRFSTEIAVYLGNGSTSSWSNCVGSNDRGWP